MFKAITLLVAASAVVVSEARFSSKRSDAVYERFNKAMMHSQFIKEKYNLVNNRDLRILGTPADTCDIFDSARGFAHGLQFSSSEEGACVVALDSSINALDDFMALIKVSYNPTTWGDIMMQVQNYFDYLANIQNSCDLQKLINTFTVDVTTFVSSMAARVGGGLILEIPRLYSNMKDSEDCYEFAYYGGKLFSLLMDYQI
jgi:hypothetical protein